MPIRRNNWYNLHSTRRYPLDDKATGTGDDGTRLLQDVLVDVHLQFPTNLGRYAYLAGLTVTDTLVTAVFVGTDKVEGATVFSPLCAVTLIKPVDEYRHYAVEPLAPGVGGFVVFGDVRENIVWRASNPEQGLLAPRTARAYDPLPIPTLRKLMEGTGLEGLVTLAAGNDLQIVKERVRIAGLGWRNAVVFRLMSQVRGVNILQKYLGPCDTSPESRTCNNPAIETINGVSPDCDGNINIRFQNIVRGPYASCGGEVLDLDVGLAEVCSVVPRQLTDRFIGRDLCAPSGSSSSASEPSSSASSVSVESLSSSMSSVSVDCAELPFCQNFDDGMAHFFVVYFGDFDFEPFDSPLEPCPGTSVSKDSFSSCSIDGDPDNCEIGYDLVPFGPPNEKSLAATDGSRRNVALWDACAYVSAVGKQITTDLQITNRLVQRNGGIILNYREVDLLTSPHVEYFHVLLDYPTRRLRLMQFNGTALIEIAGVTLGKPLQLGDWYRLTVQTFPNPGNPAATVIRAIASGVTDLTWATTTLTVSTNDFEPDSGLCGLGSDRAHARFSFFQVEEYP